MVLRDHRAGPGARPLPTLTWGTSIALTPMNAPFADLSPVRAPAGEVGRNRTRADVCFLAQVGVAEVRDVRHLAAAAALVRTSSAKLPM